MYCGNTMGVHEYFTRLGFTCPAGENIADWILDIVNDYHNQLKSRE